MSTLVLAGCSFSPSSFPQSQRLLLAEKTLGSRRRMGRLVPPRAQTPPADGQIVVGGERRKSLPDRESTEPPRCESYGYLRAVESRFCAAGLRAQCVEHAGGGRTSPNSSYRVERKDTVTLNAESNFPHRGTCNCSE